MTRKLRGTLWVSFCAVMLTACSGVGDETTRDMVTTVGTAIAEIRNGTADSESANPYVRLDFPAIACSSTLLAPRWALTAAHCVTVQVDRHFAAGDGGVFDDPFPGADATQTTVSSMKIDSNGKVVWAGALDGKFYLARFVEGLPDTSFGTRGDGRVVIDFPSATENVTDIMFQPDGRVVAVGVAGGKAALVRLNSDGSPDSSFGFLGVQLVDLGNGTSFAPTSVAFVAGRIVWAGTFKNGSAMSAALVGHRVSNGAVDPSFGIGGFSFSAPTNGAIQAVGAMAVDGSDRILLSATAAVGQNHAVVARYSSAGVADQSFSGDGWAIAPDSFGFSVARSVVRQGGQVLLGGAAGTPLHATLWRFGADGSIDPSFGKNVDGSAINTGGVGPSFDNEAQAQVIGMALSPSGDIRVLSSVSDGNGHNFAGYAALGQNGELRRDPVVPSTTGMELYQGFSSATSFVALDTFVPSAMVVFENGADTRILIAGAESSAVLPPQRARYVALRPQATSDDVSSSFRFRGVRGGLQNIVDRLYVTGTDDVALVHFTTDFPAPTSGFAHFFGGTFAGLAGQNTICRGYGLSVVGDDSTFGTFRQGTSRITSLDAYYVNLTAVPGASLPQLPLHGDSGGSCMVNGQVIGTVSRGDSTGTSGQLVRSDRDALWAQLISATP